MNRPFITLAVERTTLAPGNASARPVGAAIFGIVVAFAALLWIVSVAPTFVSFALAAGIAIAWCVWLDRHPADAADSQQRAHLASSRSRVVGVHEREEHPWDRV
jgi:hypothetical protein